MNRRGYLTAVGTTGITLLAGCAGGSLEEGDREETNSHITEAEDALKENGNELESLNEQFDDNDIPDSYSPLDVDINVAAANEQLDKAEETATEEQQTYITLLRKLGRFQKSLARMYQDYVSLLTKMDTYSAHMEMEQYEDVLSTVDEMETDLDNASSHLTEAQTIINGIDRGQFSDVGNLRYDNLTVNLTEIRDAFDYLSITIDGIRPFVKGIQDFKPAVQAFEHENYSEAKNGFSKAAEHFDEAYNTLKKLEQRNADVPGTEASFIRSICYVEALAEGADRYEGSAEAAENGDMTIAKARAMNARGVLQQCGSGDETGNQG